MVKVLELVLDRLNKTKITDNTSGLCILVAGLSDSNIISDKEWRRFHKILKSSTRRQQIFFLASGLACDDRTKYYWPRGEYEPRRIWLEEQIAILKRKPTWTDEGRTGKLKVYKSRGAVLNLIKRIVSDDEEFKGKDLSEERLFEIGHSFYNIFEN